MLPLPNLALPVRCLSFSCPESVNSDLSNLWMILSCLTEILCTGAEAELMKERFAKLLLGEDMSGGGKGVSTALAISNAITNLAGLSISHFF